MIDHKALSLRVSAGIAEAERQHAPIAAELLRHDVTQLIAENRRLARLISQDDTQRITKA